MASVRKERRNMITFCLSDEEKAKIVERAKKADMSLSDFCRKNLFKGMDKLDEKED